MFRPRPSLSGKSKRFATSSIWDKQGLSGSLGKRIFSWIMKSRRSICASSIPLDRERPDDAPSDFVRQLVANQKEIAAATVIEVGNLKPRRAFLDVKDTVRVFISAALKGGPGRSL